MRWGNKHQEEWPSGPGWQGANCRVSTRCRFCVVLSCPPLAYYNMKGRGARYSVEFRAREGRNQKHKLGGRLPHGIDLCTEGMQLDLDGLSHGSGSAEFQGQQQRLSDAPILTRLTMSKSARDIHKSNLQAWASSSELGTIIRGETPARLLQYAKKSTNTFRSCLMARPKLRSQLEMPSCGRSAS
jgi:hypothetical protein